MSLKIYPIQRILQPRALCILVGLSYIAFRGSAQTEYGCLNWQQLQRMQTKPSSEINMFLKKEGWDVYNTGFSITLNHDVLSRPELQASKTEWGHGSGNSLIIGTVQGHPNFIVLNTERSCFNQTLSSFPTSNGSVVHQENGILTSFQAGESTFEFFETAHGYYNKTYRIAVFDNRSITRIITAFEIAENEKKAQAHELFISIASYISQADTNFQNREYEQGIAKLVQAKKALAEDKYVQLRSYMTLPTPSLSEIELKIRAYQEQQCADLFTAGDSCLNASQFQAALDFYRAAQNAGCASNDVSARIQRVELATLKVRAAQLAAVGDSCWAIGNTDGAKRAFEELLTLDPTNAHAIKILNQVRDLEALLDERATRTFLYSETNPKELRQFKNLLLGEINSHISASRSGSAKLEYSILFDTLGTNLSRFNSLTASWPGLENLLASPQTRSTLLAPKKSGYCLAAAENFSLQVEWSTVSQSYLYTRFGIRSKSSANPVPTSIQRFIPVNPNPHGEYKFDLTTTLLNGRTFQRIFLSDVSTRGPGSALFSLLAPGLGTLHVSYGQEGRGRFFSFLIASAVSTSAQVVSSRLYTNYLNENDTSTALNLYNQANIAHKTALITGGFSAVLYLYDIIWVIKRGALNKQNAEHLKRKLKNGVVAVETQDIFLP